MRHVRRELEKRVEAAARGFAAVVLTGPRRAGKTSLLRRLMPKASYHLFEDPDVIARFRADPRAFLDETSLPAILDEIQNVPEIFAHVRARIDLEPRRVGRWFLTGSQESGLMRKVTESMAGRAAILHLWPMSVREAPKMTLLRGGYPEVLARPRHADLWFSSYIQTFLERDVRAITNVQDPANFRRFLGLVAARHGRVMNKTDLAGPLGLSIPTVGRWLDILETTAQVLVVPPYFENLGKRIIKSPKVYIADSGLACHLLGVRSVAELARSPFRGALFEGFVAAEIVKSQINAGGRKEIYHFRDQAGLEVDFVIPRPDGAVRLVEARASRTVRPDMTAAMRRLADAWRLQEPARGVEMYLVHEPSSSGPRSRAVAPGVSAVPWTDYFGA